MKPRLTPCLEGTQQSIGAPGVLKSPEHLGLVEAHPNCNISVDFLMFATTKLPMKH